MTTYKEISSLQDKHFHSQRPNYAISQLIKELRLTDKLQRAVDYHNLHHFKNFKLKLEMEVNTK